MLHVTKNITIPSNEIEITAIRAQGAGGQNVNKVSTAIHLRFDLNNSSLPEIYRTRLLALGDYRITKGGIIIIKAQRYRTQEKNRIDALSRLQQLLKQVAITPKKRRLTKPSIGAKKKRLESKNKRGSIKQLRRKDVYE